MIFVTHFLILDIPSFLINVPVLHSISSLLVTLKFAAGLSLLEPAPLRLRVLFTQTSREGLLRLRSVLMKISRLLAMAPNQW
jgi:hypothetical protein